MFAFLYMEIVFMYDFQKADPKTQNACVPGEWEPQQKANSSSCDDHRAPQEHLPTHLKIPPNPNQLAV